VAVARVEFAATQLLRTDRSIARIADRWAHSASYNGAIRGARFAIT